MGEVVEHRRQVVPAPAGDLEVGEVKRNQYTAIDDATRIRALKIYDCHNQSNAIDFINAIIDEFPFRIREVRMEWTCPGKVGDFW
jgi:hypothetical protein